MADYIKSPSKASLLSMLKQAESITPKFMRSLLDGVAFKSDLVASEATTSAQAIGGSLGGSKYVRRDGSTELTSNWDAGSHEIRARTLESDVATGTAPLTVASTTKVANLNADLLDDQTGSYYLDSDNFSGTEWTDLTDAGDTTLHGHDATGLTGWIGPYVETDGTADVTGPLNVKYTNYTNLIYNRGLVASDDAAALGSARFELDAAGRLELAYYDQGSAQTHQIWLSDARPQYVDETLTATNLAITSDLSAYLPLAGGSMTGTLAFSGAGDIAASANTAVCLATYTDVKARNTEYSVHGGLDSLDTGSALDSVPTDIAVTAGTGKIMVVVNAGSDLSGSITVTGTSVDRNTGAETGADTDTLTVDALTTDNSDTDASGNIRHAFTGAYITAKWFKGSVTLSTADLTLTDVDTYQVAFEQFNDDPSIELQSFDLTALATNASAWLYAYLYALEVTGDKCDITRVASLDLPAAEVSANKYYRLRRGNLATALDGTTDGIWFDLFPGPLASVYWEDINTKVWATLKHDVYGEAS